MSESNSIKLLLAEDDPGLGSLLAEFLTKAGFDTTLAVNGEEALRKWSENAYSLVVLDVMMPKMDGFTVAREIRKKNGNIPLIFLTARSMKEDTLEGFRAGADDYISKPFSMEELEARINAVLRRSVATVQQDEKSYTLGTYTFDVFRETLLHNGEERKLTSKEAAVLKLLCRNKNQVLERGEALREVWGDDSYFNSRSMDVYITRLRKYLKDDPAVEISNVHGRGFRLLVSGS